MARKGNWYKFNDSLVEQTRFINIQKEIEENHTANILQGQIKVSAYMFFYEKMEICDHHGHNININMESYELNDEHKEETNTIDTRYAKEQTTKAMKNGLYRALYVYEEQIYQSIFKNNTINETYIIFENLKDPWTVTVTKRSLNKLKPRQWVNTPLVDGYCSMIHTRMMKKRETDPTLPKILIMPTEFYDLLTTVDFKTTMDLMKNVLGVIGSLNDEETSQFVSEWSNNSAEIDISGDNDVRIEQSNKKKFDIKTFQHKLLKHSKTSPNATDIMTHFQREMNSLKDNINFKKVKTRTLPAKLHQIGFTDCNNIFDLDTIIIPINDNNIHWKFVCMNMPDNNIRGNMQYCNSIKSSSQAMHIFSLLGKYLIAEYDDKMKDKVGVELNLDDWDYHDLSETYPQQEGGNDCGIFTVKGIQWTCNDMLYDFEQDHIERFRKRMIVEFIHGYILE